MVGQEINWSKILALKDEENLEEKIDEIDIEIDELTLKNITKRMATVERHNLVTLSLSACFRH